MESFELFESSELSRNMCTVQQITFMILGNVGMKCLAARKAALIFLRIFWSVYVKPYHLYNCNIYLLRETYFWRVFRCFGANNLLLGFGVYFEDVRFRLPTGKIIFFWRLSWILLNRLIILEKFSNSSFTIFN